VEIINKIGTNYSTIGYAIEPHMSADGRYLVIPQNAVVEIKYPFLDIKGTVV
jgi:hypothetical protein